MKKTFAFLAIAIFSAVAGYSISQGGPVLVPSFLNFGANGSVTPTVGDCLNILAFGIGGTTATDAGTPCNLPPSTIAALPTCNAALEGARGTVTNGQTTPTFLGAVSTTGTTVAPVFCAGTGWVYGG